MSPGEASSAASRLASLPLRVLPSSSSFRRPAPVGVNRNASASCSCRRRVAGQPLLVLAGADDDAHYVALIGVEHPLLEVANLRPGDPQGASIDHELDGARAVVERPLSGEALHRLVALRDDLLTQRS
jgi:hypothetical protein